MSAADSLTKDQIARIQSWADEGDGLSEIQRKLDEEFEIKVTYMDLRFLIEDIGVTLKPDEPEQAKEEPDEEATSLESAAEDLNAIEESDPLDDGADDSADGDAGATVTVDELQRPGMVASGKVTFSGGKSMGWYLDQLGRLGLEPGPDPDFRPSEDQMMAFQQGLQETLQKKGF